MAKYFVPDGHEITLPADAQPTDDPGFFVSPGRLKGWKIQRGKHFQDEQVLWGYFVDEFDVDEDCCKRMR